MNATPKQKQLIHINAPTRDIKEELVQWACDDNSKTSTNDLSFAQANTILQRLGVPQHHNSFKSDAMKYASFDKSKQQHMKVLATLITMGWSLPHPKYNRTADLERFGNWLRSDRAPVRKPLRKMTAHEVTTIINALESMTVKKFGK
jgi:hypothetical protein